jgi:hypothetical protein
MCHILGPDLIYSLLTRQVDTTFDHTGRVPRMTKMTLTLPDAAADHASAGWVGPSLSFGGAAWGAAPTVRPESTPVCDSNSGIVRGVAA